MIKLTDYIVQRLIEYGVKHVFMISGGGAMHLNDSVGRRKELAYICNHHEQASAIGAEGYARASGKLAVVIVTSGPGGTNTLTGVIGQWLDSVPVLYLSGQVKRETTIERCRDIGLRQLGDQEINIVDIVSPVTKFAAQINEPIEVKRLLEKAIYLATHGRPGPVWLDIPLDVQGTMIDEDELPGYDHSEDIVTFDQDNLHSKVAQAIELLKSAERPVFLAGHGIRIANAQQLFLDVVEKMRVPVVTSMNGFDLIPSDNPFFIGRIGTVANRAGNFALQNSDLLLSVGSRNNIRQISYNWDAYARAAKKIIVDIDDAELKKSTIKPDLAIHADAKAFLEEFLSQITGKILPSWDSWREWCTERKMCYQAVLAEDREARNLVNPYYFMEVLSGCLQENELVVAGNGTAFLVMFQAGKVKKGQRFIWNSGCASMGYDLPAAIGACFANEKRQVVCIAGDGSLQMNIQELQTIVHHNLPIKLFVLNNNGYISIKQTQDNFFSGHRVACDKTCGVSFPDLGKIAAAYGLPFELIENQLGIEDRVNKILNINGPLMCEVRLITDYKFSPKLSSETKSDGQIISKPLEDLYPFLDREEFRNNLLIPEWKP